MKALLFAISVSSSLAVSALAASTDPPVAVVKKTETATSAVASHATATPQATAAQKPAATQSRTPNPNRESLSLRDGYLPPPWGYSARGLSRAAELRAGSATGHWPGPCVESRILSRGTGNATASAVSEVHVSGGSTIASSASATVREVGGTGSAAASESRTHIEDRILPPAVRLRCGLTVRAVDQVLSCQVGIGVVILDLDVESVAAGWKFRRYDVLLRVDGQPVPTVQDAAVALNRSSSQSSSEFIVARRGERIAVHVDRTAAADSDQHAAPEPNLNAPVNGVASAATGEAVTGPAPEENRETVPERATKVARTVAVSCKSVGDRNWKVVVKWMSADRVSHRCELDGTKNEIDARLGQLPAHVAAAIRRELDLLAVTPSPDLSSNQPDQQKEIETTPSAATDSAPQSSAPVAPAPPEEPLPSKEISQ